MKLKNLILALAITLSLVGFASADAVSDWNALAHTSNGVAGRAPTQAGRIVAMTHIAIHDALNAIDARYERYAYHAGGSSTASARAAIAAAGYNVLLAQNPGSAAALLTAYNNALAAVADGPEKTAGIAVGAASAAAINALGATDGSSDPCNYQLPAPGPGIWRPTGPANLPFATACWGLQVRPFTMSSSDRWLSPPRPYFDLTSATYAREFEEVKAVGRVNAEDLGLRTADQSEIARFWYPNVIFTWGRVARDVGAARNLDLWESARLFALLGTASADAGIAVWNAKAVYPFWRPVTAIQEAHTDGNPATERDADWTSYMVNPPYPDYTSGHSGQDGAAAEILVRFFETDDVNFSATSQGAAPLGGITRNFTSFSGAAQEAADSRVYGGIHFRTACRDGLRQGRNLARQVFNHHFRPVED